MIILIWAFVVGVSTITITGLPDKLIQESEDETTQERAIEVPEIERKN